MQPELYKKEIGQDDDESNSISEMQYAGKLHFALRYDKDMEGLVVKVSFSIFQMHVILLVSVHRESSSDARAFISRTVGVA